MSLILSLETATEICSVALHKDGELITEFNLSIAKGHSNALARLVEDTFEYAGHDKSELEAVAVSMGPGSYTGLRIGTSLAKGLCFGLDIPLIGINTLEAIAWGGYQLMGGDFLCPMIDARRMEVYCLIKDHSFQTVLETTNVIVDEASFSTHLEKGKVHFFGNGAEKCRDTLGMNKNAVFHDAQLIGASNVGELAYQKFREGQFEDLAYFEPFYLKEFIAGKPRKLV